MRFLKKYSYGKNPVGELVGDCGAVATDSTVVEFLVEVAVVDALLFKIVAITSAGGSITGIW